MNIAVIIPCYNQGHLLGRCVESVGWQLAESDRLLVVDDASAQSPPVHPRFPVLALSDNRGPAAARNRGVAGVEYPPDLLPDWIKFLDADDVLAPFALETFRRQSIPDSVHVVVGPQIKVVDGIQQGIQGPNPNVITQANPMLLSMAFVRRSAFLEVRGFDERIRFEEDWDFWLRIRQRYGMSAFAVVNWPVCYYTIDTAARAALVRDHTVEGMDVRAYLAKTYGITPAA